MKKKIIIGLGVVAVVVIALVWKGGEQKGGMQLEVVPVSRATISNVVTATGTVEPVTEVEVGTQVSGIVDKLYVDYNDVVKKGQLIAEMDKVTLQAELENTQAQLASCKAEYVYQQKNYARLKTLHEKSLVSDSDYETATYSYEKAKATYEQNEAAMIKVKRNLSYATITSPIDGVVIGRSVEAGQTVAAGFETPTLFTIANDLTKMQVIADVDEADIGQVEQGQHVTFTVDAYPNDVFEGEVTQVRLEATVESNVVTYEVVISAANPDLKLKPGLTANVTIYTVERAQVQTLPSKVFRFVPDEEQLAELGYTLAQTDAEVPAGKKMVWRKEGMTLMPVVVKLGYSSGGMVEIVEGVNDGDSIVLELALPDVNAAATTGEKSPFMPTPPTRKKSE